MMDDKGYAFTPLAFLLIIPVMLIAISYGNIVNEINMISAIAIGGDVTHATATNIISSLDKGASDAGRRASYNATRLVIDRNGTFFDTGQSKKYVEDYTIDIMNNYTLELCRGLQEQSGRQIYVNDILVTNSTDQIFFPGDVTVDQEDPFGFYVNIKGGIPIKVVENNQTFEGTIPTIRAYVSIEGMEDPYIWANNKFRTSTIIYKFPHYYVSSTGNPEYYFDDSVEPDRLLHLWDCLAGTGHPSNLIRSYYFYDPYGLTFFDRLENNTPEESEGPDSAKMSTFILDDPLWDEHGGNEMISCIDHEYFAGEAGIAIKINNVPIRKPNTDGESLGTIFYLSPEYINRLDLQENYYT